MFDKGKSHDHLNYDCVTVDYFEQPEIARAFVSFLCESGWTAITFTTSSYNPDPYDDLSEFSDITAHGVIGQEFSKVLKLPTCDYVKKVKQILDLYAIPVQN